MISPHLSVRDYDALHRALCLLYGRAVTIDELPQHAFGILAQHIPCENWTYIERHIATNHSRCVIRHPPTDLRERFSLFHQIRLGHPYFHDMSPLHRGNVRTISDVMSWRVYRETQIYRDVVSAAGCKFGVAISPSSLAGECVLNLCLSRTGSRDFTERDKAFFSVLQPHLLQIHEIARLRTIHEGRVPSTEELRQLGLTEREAEVLRWVAQGKANADIAIILGRREQTIKNQLHSAFARLGVRTRAAAILRVLQVPRRYVPCETAIVAKRINLRTGRNG
jgi:DNA-binding CsgD family transcriptional regulator